MSSKSRSSLIAMLIALAIGAGNSGCADGTRSVTPPPVNLVITTTSLPTGTVNVPYSVALQSSGGTPPVTWSLALGGILPPGLSLRSDGTISGAPTAPGSAGLKVLATDSTAPTPQDAEKDLSIGINAADTSHNALLNGHYAFMMSGIAFSIHIGGLISSGPDAAAGSFVADGLGNLTSGVSDFIFNTEEGGATSNQPFTGTYSLGSDNRGTMTINSPTGTVTLAFSVGSISPSGVAAKGRIINFGTSSPDDTTGGEFDLQDTTAFSTSAIAGTYAFGLGGGCQNCVFGADGVFTADGTGNLLTGEADTNQDGTFTPDQQLNGMYGVASSAFGRGTASFTFGGMTLDITFYVVSAKKLLLVSAEQGNTVFVFIGQALKQSGGPFSNGSLQGAGVLYTIAESPDVTAGLATFDGVGAITLLQDQNNKGSITSGTMTSESYSVASNGRVTVTAAGSTVSSIYLVSPGMGFILNADSDAGTGFLEPQSAGPFSNSSINGTFFFGDPSPCHLCFLHTLAISGVAMLNAGSFNQTVDANIAGRLFYDQTSADTYSVSFNGRATIGSGN